MKDETFGLRFAQGKRTSLYSLAGRSQIPSVIVTPHHLDTNTGHVHSMGKGHLHHRLRFRI